MLQGVANTELEEKMDPKTVGITISRALRKDIPEILALQKVAFIVEAELHGNYNIEPLTQTAESVAGDFETHVFLKAVKDGKIIGSVKARETAEGCWIGKLMVHPQFRRMGLATMLMSEIEKEFSGTSSYYLYTAGINKGNVSLYQSLGYRRGNCHTDESGVVLVRLDKENRRF